MSTLICPHCGMANRAGANFCNNCGTDLRAEEAPLPENVEPALETGAPTHDAASTAELGKVDPEIGDDQRIEAVEIDVTIDRGPAVHDEASGRDSDDAQDTEQENRELLVEQPWLQRDDDAPATPVDRLTPAGARVRTLADLQGLLPLLDLSRSPTARSSTVGDAAPAVANVLSTEQTEEVRYLMGETPAPMADSVPLARLRRRPGLRIPWLFWLLGLAVALPLFLLVGDPAGSPRQWPGVGEAYATVAALPADAPVLAFWAYDPATAGEMDLLAVPVLRHLNNQQAELAVVSLLPGGPASARRALATALYGSPDDDAMLETADRLELADQWLAANLFLPGGVAGLPLVVQAPAAAFQSDDAVLRQKPELAVLFAARAEDVQIWLEQVQPLNDVAVVAVTSAGADPLLRPYLDSGQLTGLVSGFDGAYAYEELAGFSRPLAAEEVARVRLAAQNWGQLALLLILVLGNLAGLFGSGGRD